MIAANELRIGNWVMIDGIKTTIDSVQEDIECDPIPLTAEILEKSGLRISMETLMIGDYAELCTARDNGFYYLMFEGCVNNKDAPIKYVHQLQNLYFALTNQELNIQL